MPHTQARTGWLYRPPAVADHPTLGWRNAFLNGRQYVWLRQHLKTCAVHGTDAARAGVFCYALAPSALPPGSKAAMGTPGEDTCTDGHGAQLASSPRPIR